MEKRLATQTDKGIFGRIIEDKTMLLGLIIIVIIVIIAIFAPLIAPYDPLEFYMTERLEGPSQNHLFGTDNFGRDVFSRVVFGTRVSMRVGMLVLITVSIFGTLIGLVTGYISSLDYILMRVMDAFMAFPSILLGISIVAILGASEINVAIALSIVYIPRTARVVRGTVLGLKNSEFVKAARAMGASDLRIIMLHILPNSLAALIVQLSFVFASSILAEAGLSFVGAGPAPPIPSWGNILSEGREYIRTYPWMTIFPGLFIALTVLGLNLAGDGLRDVLDPRLVRGGTTEEIDNGSAE